jgi:muramoyltetrapeptide carboxypeptidase
MTGLSALGLGLATGKTKGKDFVETATMPAIPQEYLHPTRKLPPGLHPGSTVAITAPASPTSMYEIRNGRRYFQNLGCKVIVGDTIAAQKNEHRYLSAPDIVRAQEFMDFISDRGVDAILCGRGGYGSMRILQHLDFNKIAQNPKIILGFSDITALLNAVYRKTGIVTYHGPVASMDFESFTGNSLKSILFRDHFNPHNHINHNKAIVINPGIAGGELVGGNLTILTSMLGTEFEIESSGKIIFLEDVSEHAYQIDRMITQLLLAGKIQSASAVIFGTFKNLKVRRPFYPNRGYTILEVIQQLLKQTNVPTIVGFPFGHISSKVTLPIGIRAELNTEKKSLKLIENTVS